MENAHPGGFVKTNWRQIIIGFFSLVIIAVSLFNIGGEDFVYIFSNNISSFQALAILIMTIALWFRMGQKSQNRMLWLGLMIGWSLWTIAEWWWGIASLLQEEAPFPSVADFFWILGYIPMYIALESRNRSIPEDTSALQKTIIWLGSVAAIGLTAIFIVNPVIQNYAPGTALETVLTLFYPLGDLVLFIFVLRVAFKYQQGMNGQAWLWIAGGYIVNTISDLIFSYANANNLYYPNGQTNLISSIGSDLLYSLSYMVIMMGLAIMRSAGVENQSSPEPEIDLPVVDNIHVLFFTDKDDLINDVSHNYTAIFDTGGAIGQPLGQAIGIPIDQAGNLISQVKSKRLLEEQSITIATRMGVKTAKFCGETLSTPDGGFAGLILLVRVFMGGESLDEGNSEYHRSIIRSLIRKTGSKEDLEIKTLLTLYCSHVLKGWIDVVETEGGNLMGHSVSGKLQTVANESNWKISVDSEGNIDTSNLSLEDCRQNLREVMTRARQITTEITDEATVKKVELRIWNKLTPAAHQNLTANGVPAP